MSKVRSEIIPTGWAACSLDDVADLVRGIAFPKEAKYKTAGESRIACLRTTNVQQTVEWDDLWWVPEKYVRSSDQIVLSGDILISVANSYERVGRVARVNQPPVRATLGAFIAVIRPRVVDSRFLYYILSSPTVQRSIQSKASTTTNISNVNTSKVRATTVRIAPLAEQVRVADALDELLSDLDAGVKALKVGRAKLQQYRSVVLQAAAEGVLTAELRNVFDNVEPASEVLKRILAERRQRWEEARFNKYKDRGQEPPKNWKVKYEEPAAPEAGKLPPLPKGWCWASVDQLAAPELHAVTDGPFGSNLMTSHYTEAGPRVVRLQNVGEMYFSDERAHISETHFQSLKKHSVKAGDIVIAALGEVLPRACVIPESLGPAIVKADCVRFRAHPEISARALCGFLNSPPTRARMSQVVHGVGRPRLNLREIKEIALPLPPVAEQQAIATEIEDQLSVIDHLESDIEAKLKSAQALRQSILKAAFEGKLVLQDPNDEPVDELLKRIAAERSERGRVAKESKRVVKLGKVRRPKRGQNLSAVSTG